MKPTLNKIALTSALAMVLSGVTLATPQDDLCNAVEHSRSTLVQKYIAQDVDPGLKTHGGAPLLVNTLKGKNIEAAETLIYAKDINFEHINATGENALMMVAYQGLLPMVRLMVETYDVGVNKTGRTVPYCAAINGCDDIVKYLLDHATYIDAESPNATTPLVMVAMGGHITIIKLLLDESTDMSLRNQQKMDVIDFARRYHQDEIAVELESHRRKLAGQPGKPASASVPATTVSPPAKAVAPGVPTPMPLARHDAGTPSPAGRSTTGTPTNMLFGSNRWTRPAW